MLAFKEAEAEERDLRAERKDAERRNDRDGEKEAELKIQRLPCTGASVNRAQKSPRINL